MGVVEIPIPPSANAIWRIVSPRMKRPFITRSQVYLDWLADAVATIRCNGIGLAVLPARIAITIRGGKGWRANRDIDNVAKPVMDALVLAGRIPDDSTQYVHSVELRYAAPRPKQVATCVVEYETE